MIKVPINEPFKDYKKIEKELNKLKNEEKEINAPELINKLVFVLKKFRYNSLATNTIVSIVLVKLSQAITAKRVKFKEVESNGFPNLYNISFIPSGYGKDRLCNDLDNYFLKYYYSWFDNKVEKFIENKKQKIRKKSYEKYPDIKQEKHRTQFEIEEIKKIRYLIPEVSDGTREGFHADSKAFLDAGFGSLLVKISEFGSFLNDATSEQKLFLNQLFEAYTGKVVAKSIKSEGREKNIENLPVNALLFSDPTIFQYD